MPLPAESLPHAQRAGGSTVRQRLRALGLGHALTLAAALLTLLLATFVVPVRAQAADAEAPPLREVTLPAGTFTRDTVLPTWVEPLPLPVVRAREPVLALLIDRQVHLQGTEVSVYAETAIQINETALLSLVGLMQVSFAPDHQRLVLHKAHLVRGSRTIDVTARAGVRFLQPRDEAPAQTYTGQVTAVLLLDDVRVGDVLVMAWRIDGNNPVFGEHLSFGLPWDAPLTALQRRVRVLHPSAQPIHWRMLGDAGRPVPEPRSTSAGDWVDWRIEERDIAASALEPQVPDHWFEWRLLQISTWSDWPAVSRWAQALFAPDTGPLPEELETLLQRARALPDDDARVQLVLDWVQREIRYFALAVGESSHRPHPPALVLQRRWGDCKDKTQLLLTLLARLGIAAEPVLVSQQLPRAPAKGLPTPLAFDHVIARVRLGGDVLFLDATRAAQGVALRAQAQPPEWVQGLLADGRAPAPQPLVATPPGPMLAQRAHEHVRLATLGPEATMSTTLTFDAGVAERVREGLRAASPAQRRAWVLAPYEEIYRAVTLVGEPRFEDDLQANRLTVHAELRLPQFAQPHGSGWRAPFRPTWLYGTLQMPPMAQRQYPVRVAEFPHRREYRLVVDWPEQVTASDDPQHRRMQGLVFDAEAHRSFRGPQFSIEFTVQTTAQDVAAADLPRLAREVEQLIGLLGGDIVIVRGEIVAERRAGESAAAAAMRQRMQEMVDAVSGALQNPAITGKDRAEALCVRAEGLAHLGRVDEAARDAALALRLDERSAAVWTCQGSVAWHQGDFARADAAYTRAQSLGADLVDVLHARGFVRLAQQRLDAAALDFERAAAARSQAGGEHVFARIGQAMALRRAGQPLPAALLALAQRDAPWPRSALALMADLTTPEALLQGLQALPQAERDLALSEAWYVIGQWHLARGDTAAAVQAFQRGVAQQITPYFEHTAAVHELRRLGR